MKRTMMLLALLLPLIAQAGDLWVTAMVGSKHYADSSKYNEQNFGLGLEYHVNEDWSLVGGAYKNSLSKESHYLGAAYTPLHVTDSIKVGIVAGVIDGYKFNHGGPAPLLAGTIMVKLTDRVGFNLIFTPTVKNTNQGAVALQLKLKF
jgi:hypothetical protein